MGRNPVGSDHLAGLVAALTVLITAAGGWLNNALTGS